MKTVFPSVVAGGLIACGSVAQAEVCRSVRHCATLVERHAPEAFDYGVLAAEVARLNGVEAVVRLWPDAPEHVLALAARPEAPEALREAVFARWPEGNPWLYLGIAEAWGMPNAVRARVIRTLDHPSLEVREVSRLLLARQVGPFQADAATLEALLVARPVPESVALLAQLPDPRAVGALRDTLRGSDPDTTIAAFLALEARDATAAHADLEAVFRASASRRPAKWAELIARAGMDGAGFDAGIFIRRLRSDASLPPELREAITMAALLHPADEVGDVGPGGRAVAAELTRQPVNLRLAATAPTHSVFRDKDLLVDLAEGLGGIEVWAGHDAERALITLAETVATTPGIGEDVAASTLRVVSQQGTAPARLAALDALRQLGLGEDTVREAVSDSIDVARAARRHLGQPPPSTCTAGGEGLPREIKRLPYFEGARRSDGTRLKRWELVDAQPVRGGWLAAYDDVFASYRIGKGAEVRARILEGVEGQPVAVLPASSFRKGRYGYHVLIAQSTEGANIYGHHVSEGLGLVDTIPGEVRVIHRPKAGPETPAHLAWALDFDGDQPTLAGWPLRPVCDAP